jgi:hypothetical protein
MDAHRAQRRCTARRFVWLEPEMLNDRFGDLPPYATQD